MAVGSTPQHLAWTVLGAATITVWPAFTARRGPGHPLILTARGAAAVTVIFLALSGWLLVETRDGTLLGLSERVMSGVMTTWPFIVALGGTAGSACPSTQPPPPGARPRRHLRPAPGLPSQPLHR